MKDENRTKAHHHTVNPRTYLNLRRKNRNFVQWLSAFPKHVEPKQMEVGDCYVTKEYPIETAYDLELSLFTVED